MCLHSTYGSYTSYWKVIAVFKIEDGVYEMPASLLALDRD